MYLILSPSLLINGEKSGGSHVKINFVFWDVASPLSESPGFFSLYTLYMSYSNKRQKSSTTRLPASLQEELGIESKSNSNAARGQHRSFNGVNRGGNIVGRVIGRKEARKAERRDKRGTRGRAAASKEADRPKKFANAYRERIDAEAPSSAHTFKGKAREKPRPAQPERSAYPRPQKPSASREQRKHVDEEEATPLQRLMTRSGHGESSQSARLGSEDAKKSRKRIALNSVEQQEEDEIAWLEAHLGKKEAKKEANFKDDDYDGEEDIGGGEDGLDDLLEDLDRFYPGMYEKEQGDQSQNSDTEVDEGEEDDESDQSSSEASMSGEVSEGDLDEDSESAASLVEPEANLDVDKVKVDLPRSDSVVEGKYIPPALRKKMAESQDDEKRIKLQRQAKGLLNRLGEGNLDVIVTELLDTLYRQYSRAEVTNILTNLILQTISSSSNLVETFVVLHATLITSLHRLVGIEFGAHFLQTIVESWSSLYRKASDVSASVTAEDAGRELKNLTSLLSHLYNVGLIACPLIFDIIKLLISGDAKVTERQMTDIDVELLHKIVKTSGQQLRHDDATALKTIIQLASQSATSISSHTSSSRSRFMLEALENLKTTRMKSNTNQSLEQQSIIRMKKYLNGLSRKKIVRTQEPLRVGLKDLQDADKRGRWLLVGAAWAGHDTESTKLKENTDNKDRDEAEVKAEALRNIARKHGMNTTIRQDIFVILISSQDYLDALERLQSLKFKKEIQRREIIRVLLHCIGSEVHYNPYYVVLASRLAIDDIGTRFTLQYCLWDFMRELGEKEVGGRSIVEREDEEEHLDRFGDDEDSSSSQLTSHRIANIARAYGWWFAKSALSLSATKVINFTSLKSRAITFLQQVFVHLCLSIHTTSPALTLRLVSKRSIKGDAYMIKHDKTSTIDEAAKKTLESVLVKGTLSNATHSQGLLFFLERHLQKPDCIRISKEMGASEETMNHLLVSRNIMKHILKVGASSGGISHIVD